MNFPKLSAFRTAAALREHLRILGIADALPVADSVPAAPHCALSRPFSVHGRRVGNRFAILPMEGWDGGRDGAPTDLVRRRWQRFGQSGAKLIWGGEAAAVRHDGRANPHQLLLNEANLGPIRELRELLARAHADHHGATDDLLIGLQLTHSGRFARPNDERKLEPRIAYRHPLLDARFGIASDDAVLTDLEIAELIGDFVAAGVRAQHAGFDFVDIKHCHGYLGHEFLSAVNRPGPYGGPLENRTRFLREIVAGIRREAPGLEIGVRLSLFDQLPFQPGPDRVGRPSPWAGSYPHAFGADPADPAKTDWTEPLALLRQFRDLGIHLVCLTAGSPYYNPHIQRPASMPPSDGYLPPEDPLVGVARQAAAAARARAEMPELTIVGSALTYLQEWLPAVAEGLIADGRMDAVGLGRMVLSYPQLPADVLAGRPLVRKQVCRTFSECTTGPRNGLVSGCFPLDDFYKQHPDAARLKALSPRAR